ncbi:MAG: STAS domain-containing protein [Solirubrobacterales bacterium]
MQDPPRGRGPLQFELEAVVEDPRTTLRLAGELDAATVPELEVALARAERARAKEIVVDVERLTFIDSTGLQTLVALQRRLNGDGPELVVRRPTEEVARMFSLVGLDKLLRITED